MPNPQSLDDLQNILAGEIGWRKKEIVAFRSAARRASAAQACYCRAGAVMLCAHWEGFLKNSVQAYINYVFSQALPLVNLTTQFVAVYFFGDVMNAAKAQFPGSEQQHLKLAAKISASGAAPCVKPSWKVKTGGNPTSDVTCDVLASVGLDRHMGLDEAGWSIQKVFIDAQLLKDRHRVAHGERYPVDQSDLRDRSNRVIDMCERLLRLIIDAAGSEAYVKRRM